MKRLSEKLAKKDKWKASGISSKIKLSSLQEYLIRELCEVLGIETKKAIAPLRYARKIGRASSPYRWGCIGHVKFSRYTKSISGFDMREMSNRITSIAIPNSVTSIDGGAVSVAKGNHRYHSAGNCVIETESKTLVLGCRNSVIPSDGSVTSIGNSAFSGCPGLTNVTIPGSVMSIGWGAFRDCTGLTSVTIGSGVTSIDSSAFDGCIGLTNINYTGDIAGWCGISGLDNLMSSSKALYIGENKVEGELIIPNCVTTIPPSAFYGCSGLTSIVIPSSETSIGRFAFSECTGLTSITIPNSVTSIGDSAFSGCTGLTSITIPDSVTSIKREAFYGCSGLTSINYTGDIAGWCGISGLDNLMSSSSSKALYIGENKVEGELIIPDSVTSIGDYAFYGCTGLTSVTIGSGVTSIGSSAFYGCSGLTSIVIPSNVTSIGDSALAYCSCITKVNWNSTACANAGSPLNPIFKGCTNLSEVNIGENVTAIPSHVFCGCQGLTSITVPDSVTSIGDFAFSGCSMLSKVNWNATSCMCAGSAGSFRTYKYSTYFNAKCCTYTDDSYMNSIFRDCTNLSKMSIGENVTTIPPYAFSGCSGLTSITIPNGVTNIGSRAFEDCIGLTRVTIGNSVTSISERAFYGCSGLTSITIPNGVTNIGPRAFEDCIGLTRVTIGNSVTSIRERAFV